MNCCDRCPETEEGCNINWREGKFDKKDETFSKAGAHTRQAMGPAVLGFDNDLDAFCKLEDPEALEGGRADASCGNHNRLYLKQWTLCKNMKWILCAGMGFLPGQNGVGEIIMVTPVSKMDGGRMAKPEDVPEGTPPLSEKKRKDYEDERHRVPEAFGVTVHEVCTLNRMCSNGDEVFGVAEGATFVCEDPTIPMDLLTDAGAQVLTDTAEDGNVPEELDTLNFRRAVGTSKLRGNDLMGTLEHVDQILEKELDILARESRI